MKKVLKKSIPLLMAVIVLFQTVYSSVETAKAAALPEVIYYTYWDLISSLYGVCGYDTKIDESVINNHSVTGKQAWDNFVTFVENSAKANYKFLEDGASKAFSELENLVNNVTDKGFSITQDLYDMLKSVFADQVANNNKFNTLSEDSIKNMIYSICGVKSGSLGSSGVVDLIKSGRLLNICKVDSNYFIFCCKSGYILSDMEKRYSLYLYVFNSVSDGSQTYSGYCSACAVVDYTGKISEGSFGNSAYSYPNFIIKNGSFVGTDTIGAQTSAEACPKEVPEVVPWRKEVTVPDEWRVIPGGGSDEDPDKDPEKNPDALPVWLPIKPLKPDKPDSTEDPSTETPEDPNKKDDPDKKKEPVVNPIINPSTGNVVDPNTGLDIDPATGKLIDPDTGELIDPDMSDSVNKVNKYGDITKLFPFCIPFDLVKLIKGMSAEKAPPVFHFEHKFKGINYTFVVDVDLSDYDKYIKVFRFGLQVIFVITLMFLTVKFSKLFS